MSVDEKLCVVAYVRGNVTGVGFRAFVCEQANQLGVAGVVGNRSRDMVEVWAQGSRADVEALVAALHKGPTFARVHEVEVNEVGPEEMSGVGTSMRLTRWQ